MGWLALLVLLLRVWGAVVGGSCSCCAELLQVLPAAWLRLGALLLLLRVLPCHGGCASEGGSHGLLLLALNRTSWDCWPSSCT